MAEAGSPGMKKQAIKSAFPYTPKRDIDGIVRDLRQILISGRLILGPFLEQFEKEFADYIGVQYAVGLSSCTAALEAVFRYLALQGGEVIVPTNTFVASANAVIYAGANPVFCDIDKTSLALDLDDMNKKITKKTKAVIVVHIGGNISTSIWDIKNICDKKGIPLIEDASHAHGATVDGRKAGSIGMAGCFSMYPTKVMTTSCGGTITTNDLELARFCSVIRHHGAGSHGLRIPEIQGNDWLMDEISASIGRHQLAQLESNLASRSRIANLYRSCIKDIDRVSSLPVSPRVRNSYYKYIAIIENKRVDVPNAIVGLSKKYNVELAQLYFPPCHLQPIFRRWGRGLSLPNSEDILRRSVALPMHVALNRQDVYRVVDVLRLISGRSSGPI